MGKGPWAGRARTRRRLQEGNGRGDGLSDSVGRLRLPRPAFYRMAGPAGKIIFLRQSQSWNGGTKAGGHSALVVKIERMVVPAVTSRWSASRWDAGQGSHSAP